MLVGVFVRARRYVCSVRMFRVHIVPFSGQRGGYMQTVAPSNAKLMQSPQGSVDGRSEPHMGVDQRSAKGGLACKFAIRSERFAKHELFRRQPVSSEAPRAANRPCQALEGPAFRARRPTSGSARSPVEDTYTPSSCRRPLQAGGWNAFASVSSG